MKKITRAGILAVMLGLTVAGTAGNVWAGSGTLKIGVRDDIMHFGYLNPDTGKYYGLEIDLAAKLVDLLGYEKAEYVTVVPETRKNMLLNGDVDCLIAAYSVENTRLENFDFSPAYYTDYSSIMVEKSSMLHQLSDLVGKRIGVLDGANTGPKLSIKMIEEGLITEEDTKGTVQVKLDSYNDLSIALEEGTVDAVCMDGCIARAYMEDDREILEDKVDQEEYAVATQKDSELSSKMAEAVQKLLDDGTVDALIEKWR